MKLTAEDNQEIISLACMYCFALDGGNVSGVVNLFTEDATFVVSSGSYAGRDLLEKFFRKNIEKDQNERHFLSNHLVSGEGNTAFHTCYYQVIVIGDNTLKATGIYEDHLAKVNGVWRFEHRKVVPNIRNS